jgi:ABC-type Zn2+ transport system substrate-binding protein/surface adhesin
LVAARAVAKHRPEHHAAATTDDHDHDDHDHDDHDHHDHDHHDHDHDRSMTGLVPRRPVRAGPPATSIAKAMSPLVPAQA